MKAITKSSWISTSLLTSSFSYICFHPVWHLSRVWNVINTWTLMCCNVSTHVFSQWTLGRVHGSHQDSEETGPGRRPPEVARPCCSGLSEVLRPSPSSRSEVIRLTEPIRTQRASLPVLIWWAARWEENKDIFVVSTTTSDNGVCIKLPLRHWMNSSSLFRGVKTERRAPQKVQFFS